MRPFAAAAVAALALAGSAAATPPDMNKLLLTPGQVGVAYVLIQRPDGHGLGTRTLDLCGVNNYPSEKLRTARIQVDYGRNGSALGLSNEVVTYKSGGAAQAMREVIHHATHCPHTPISPGVQGLPPLTFQITRLTAGHLLKGYLAVKVRVTGTVKGKKVEQTSYAVYQRLGNVLSGVYSFGPATPQQMTFCLHAAEQSARNLRRLQAPSGPTV
jgi:hypothetical protein